ncbi:hypothetical protein L3Q82_014265, partial [Scortum barcoo]
LFFSGCLCQLFFFLSLIDFIAQEAVKTENNEHINLKVAGQDGSVVQFKIKRHTPLIKLMKAYCERQMWNPATNKRGELSRFRPMREAFCGVPSNESGVLRHSVQSERAERSMGWHRRTNGSGVRYSTKMTTTTTFKGMEPGTKNSSREGGGSTVAVCQSNDIVICRLLLSRVLRPPGGASSFSLGTDEDTTPQRKSKMASSIFGEPEDPHAHRRNNPPKRHPTSVIAKKALEYWDKGGTPTGTLCGEPSAPLRRCQQPLLFPKNPQPELTTIHNSGAAMVWSQRQEVPLIESDRSSTECPDDGEQQQQQQEEQQQQQQKEMPQPSEPSG